MDFPQLVAAGAVVSRKGPQVLLVHRPKYDDWSFPKGKLDPGEHALTAAVREVEEETGLEVRLGPPLSDRVYATGTGRTKRVHYWIARPAHEDDLSTYQVNEEIDELAWLDVDVARERLTYPRDRDVLEEYLRLRKRSAPLIVLRHGHAGGGKLSTEGLVQAAALVSMLGAYGVERVISSSTPRAWATVAPYAHAAGLKLEVTDDLTVESATQSHVTRVVHGLMATKRPSVLCTHQPVLPQVMTAVGLPPRDLSPGEMLVAHHRKGEVLAVELHQS